MNELYLHCRPSVVDAVESSQSANRAPPMHSRGCTQLMLDGMDDTLGVFRLLPQTRHGTD